MKAIFYSGSGTDKKAPLDLKAFCPEAKSICVEAPNYSLDEMKRKVDLFLE
jgi:hypothetical protein